jgi:hypothetical protein
MGVFWIPADTDIPMQFKCIGTGWQDVNKFLGGYVESVHTEHMPELACGCAMVMLVDEEGLLKRLPFNTRASIYYPFGPGISGDAIVLGQGLVSYNHAEAEPDWFGLPQEFTAWEGPGSPIPAPVAAE